MKIKELIIGLLIICLGFLMTLRFEKKSYNYYSGTIISEKSSNFHNYKAMKTERSTGATTRFTYNLFLIENGKYLTNESQPIFISYDNFDYYWDSENLVVVINSNEAVFRQETSYNKIPILYKTNNK